MDLIVSVIVTLVWMIFIFTTLLLCVYGLAAARMYNLLDVLTNRRFRIGRRGASIALKMVAVPIAVWALSGISLVVHHMWF